ncbi:MAG: hypothetical protein PHX83_06695 [Acidobacteriia bacterium]|nr:hypothetical protein [Terriglobia bacterium]
MKTQEARDRLAKAIVAACREHGVPNTFTPGELEAYYTNVSRMMLGQIGKRHLDSLNSRLADSGYRATYVGRVFAVTEANIN